MSLPYSSKVEGFVGELDMPISPVQDTNAGQLLACVNRSWDVREELRSRIDEHLPPLVERAGKTADLAVDLIRDTSSSAAPAPHG